jgi:hypothetical protein
MRRLGSRAKASLHSPPFLFSSPPRCPYTPHARTHTHTRTHTHRHIRQERIFTRTPPFAFPQLRGQQMFLLLLLTTLHTIQSSVEPQRNNDPPGRQGLLFKPANTTGDIARFILVFQGDQGSQRPNGLTLQPARGAYVAAMGLIASLRYPWTFPHSTLPPDG